MKKVFIWLLSFGGLACIAEVSDDIKCISLNNQLCHVRPTFVNANSSELKCGGSCDNIDDPCARRCVSDKVRNMNAKVFHLM